MQISMQRWFPDREQSQLGCVHITTFFCFPLCLCAQSQHRFWQMQWKCISSFDWLHWTRKGVQTSDQQPGTGGPDALTTSVGWAAARRAVAWVWAKGIPSHPMGKEWAKCQGSGCLLKSLAQPQVIHLRAGTVEQEDVRAEDQHHSPWAWSLSLLAVERRVKSPWGPALQKESCLESPSNGITFAPSCTAAGREDEVTPEEVGGSTWKEWHFWHGPLGSSRSLVFPSSVLETVGDGLHLFSFGNVVARQLFYTL